MSRKTRQILSLMLSAVMAVTAVSPLAQAEEGSMEEAGSEWITETEFADSDETEAAEESDLLMEEEQIEETENEQMIGDETEEFSYEPQEGTVPVPGVYENTWENLTYIYTGSSLTIGGTGTMTDYDFSEDEDGNPEYDKYPWFGYRDSVRTITIGDGVTRIANGAFYGFELLQTVNLGKGIRSIGESAFYMDEKLQNINWGQESSVTTIEESAFDNCSSLTTLNIPDSVQTIGDYAFDTCEALEEIHFGKNVKTIGEGAFSDCSSVKKLTLPASVRTIGDNAFDTCEALEEIHFLGDAPKIGEDAFADVCTGDQIEEDVVFTCYYPAGNTTWKDIVSANPTYGAEKIKWVEEGIVWDLKDGVLTIRGWSKDAEEFESAADAPWYEDCAKIVRIVIEDQVEKIGDYAFECCSNARCVWFMGSTPAISRTAFQGVTTKAYCNPQKGWTGSYTNYGGDMDWIRWRILNELGVNNLVLDGQGEMEDVAYFENATDNDPTMTYQEDMPWHSERSRIEHIDVGNGITHIGSYAFEGYNSLKSVKIRSSVTSVGRRAFAFAEHLKEADMEAASIEETGEEAFYGCQQLKEIKWPEMLKKISEQSFCKCVTLKTLYLPDEVTEIGKGGFEGCSELEKVYFSEKRKLQIIGEEAFRYCYSLNYMAVPDGVTTIGARAFSGCSGLEKIILHEDITHIEKEAFDSSVHLCAYETEPNYIEEYAQENQLRYASLDTKKRSSSEFSAARDGWCLINSPDLYGGTDVMDPSNYLLLYDVRPSSLVYGAVTSVMNMFKDYLKTMDGRCFGFSVLAAGNYEGKINLKNYFSQDGDGLNAYGYQSITGTKEQNQMFSIKDNGKMQLLLDRAHISQKSKEFKETEVFQYDSHYSGLIAAHNSGNLKPYIVTLQNSSMYGHAVVIDPSQIWAHDGGSIYQIPLYNPNTPYITKHLDTPSTIYGQYKSYLEINTDSGSWEIVEDGTVIAKSDYYFFGVEIYTIRFYDPTKLPDDFFTGRLHLSYMEEVAFARIEMQTEELYCYLTDKLGNLLLEVKGGSITQISDQVELSDVKLTDGKLEAFSIELPKEGFHCQSSSASVSVFGENGYLYGSINGAGTMSIDPQEVSCRVKAESSSDIKVELQKNTGEDTYIAASFEGTVQRDDTTFAFCDDKTASISSEDKNNAFDVAMDDGTKTVQYDDVKVKNAEEISPDKGITPCREGEHNYKNADRKNPTCVTAGYQIQRCVDCHAEHKVSIPATGVHTYGSWKISRKATALRQGEKVRSCSICKKAQKTSTAKLKATIRLNAAEIPLKVKQSTSAVKVSGLAYGDKVVSWRSGNNDLVSVSASGKITAKKKAGKTTVTVRLASGLEKSITVKVQKKAVATTKIGNVTANVTLKAGKSYTLKPVLSPITSLQKATYKSSNKKTAAVNAQGKIVAKKKGTAVITVKSGKKTAKCKVTVK